MLQVIRDKAQGWIAWAIVILISIPFALWGIQSYLGIGSEPVAATVNGTEITERTLDSQFQRFRQQLREQLGSAYRPEMFDDVRMRKEVLHRLVRDELLQQTSQDIGLRAGSAMIQATILSMPTFQKDGQFDQQTYERALRLQGLSPAGFEDRVRRALVAEQLSQAVQVGSFITKSELAESQRLLNQTRELSYFLIPTSEFTVDGGLSDDEISAYYQANENAFLSPEKVKVDYILLDAETAGSTVSSDEDILRGYYDKNQDEFGLPEQRQASHILIQVTEDADQTSVDEAMSKIEALAERVRGGESFADLAKEHSQDPGSASVGGDLGYFGMGIMAPAFETAAFALQDGEVSEPVRTSFGFHLIKLTGIKAGDVKPFDEARSEVEAAYRKIEGERLYFEMAEQLADLSYEDPNSLEPASSVLGLSVQQSDWFSRDQATGLFSKPKVVASAYSDDVLRERNNSELIEIDGTSSIVLRILDHQEASILPLNEVKDQIIETLQKQKGEQQAAAEAEKRLAEIGSGSPLTQVAGSYAVMGPLTVGRNDTKLPMGLSSVLFRTEKPVVNGFSSGSARLASGDIAVYVLTGVKEGSVEEASSQQQTESLRRMRGRDYYEMVLADLESRADVEILLKSDSE
ncbi:MAG: SurA N-terminal domain-containing protein [Candidatus Thiodiazotropha sp.]|nr:SurA N-terminal domain-containing protein [Candidatus Thiodiazotropha sp.]MCM8883775.1 SurA N-terminal domain-containing protein [Candidatus Thiodiazotropha sp.]MCM8919966.1 SurA N-terminal domain-containing protein [Candidatus Thiodiazotropha sp.]